MNSLIFSNSNPAAEFDENSQQEIKQGFVLIKFEKSRIDQIRQISESGYFPIAKTTTRKDLVVSEVSYLNKIISGS